MSPTSYLMINNKGNSPYKTSALLQGLESDNQSKNNEAIAKILMDVKFANKIKSDMNINQNKIQ